MNFQIDDAGQMEQFGSRFAGHCKPPVLIALQGMLGSGKTTFVRGFLHGLGHAGHVKSPTYTLVEPYTVGEKKIYHFDFYRVSDPGELEAIGFRDYLEGDYICLVEWPENGEGILPVADVFIHFEYLGSARTLDLEANTDTGRHILNHLKS
jgi:tRNA threonylcarbamoyladenosine biosynthesis protein TsaE